MMLRYLILVCINKLFNLYNIVSRTWESDSFTPYEMGGVIIESPIRRMHHAADVFGCMLVVQGGFSGEEKMCLSDF